MVKQLIYDSCMIVEKGTIMFVCYDIQVIYNKQDGMIVVFRSIVWSHLTNQHLDTSNLFKGDRTSPYANPCSTAWRRSSGRTSCNIRRLSRRCPCSIAGRVPDRETG